MDITEEARDIYRLEMHGKGGARRLVAYFIAHGGGAVIDPGPTSALPGVLDGMKHLGMKGLELVIPTHIHVDHGGGIGRLAELFPDAKIVLHPLAVKHAVDPSRLIEGTKMAFGPDFELRYGPVLPVPKEAIVTPADGEAVLLGDRRLRVFHAPGHAPHHIAILEELTGGLFCGEALGVPSFDPEVPMPGAAPPAFDPEVTMETMEKLRALRPSLLFYGHDGVGKAPDRLIAAAAQNVKAVGEALLPGFNAGEPMEALSDRYRRYVRERFGRDIEAQDGQMTVTAYAMYFKKRRPS